MVSVSISHSDFIFILRDFFLHKYIYIGLHIEYPTLHFSPYTSYAPVVASPHSRAIKGPVLKLLGLAFSPHSTFPPSLSYTEVVSTTATKHVTGLEISTSPLARSWGSNMDPSPGVLGMLLEQLPGESALASLSAFFLLQNLASTVKREKFVSF